MTATTPTAGTGSAVVRALESVWSKIRERHPELPEVVIITGSGLNLAGLKWGHFWDDAWTNGRFRVSTDGVVERDRKPEVFVSGERLGVGAVETVQTMLHEAAHALGAIRRAKTTSRQNRYHNGRFLEIAREVGLDYPHGSPDKVLGYSAVEITDAARETYADVIAELQEAITVTMELPGWIKAAVTTGGGRDGGDGMVGGPRRRRTAEPSRNNVKATCACEPARIIRLSQAVLDGAAITCGACDAPFTAAE